MTPMHYFHIRDGSTLEIDPDGTELPDTGAAHAEALKMAHELLQEVADLGQNAIIELADGHGRTILTMPLPDALWLRHRSYRAQDMKLSEEHRLHP
jgi:hypothetical protein